MYTYLVRHGLSEANNRDNIGTPLFGNPDAGLMELGREQARRAGQLFFVAYGKDPLTARAATSTMLRTHETALAAGFREENLTAYPLLDEISNRLSQERIAQALTDKEPPVEAVEQIDKLLAHPPEEEIWFTHGFVIATICHVINLRNPDKQVVYPHFIPKHGTIRPVDLAMAS